MLIIPSRVLVPCLSFGVVAIALPAHGQFVELVEVDGTASCDAYAYDYKSGEEASDEYSVVVSSFGELPVSGGVSAATKFASGSGSVTLAGANSDDRLYISADAGGDAYGDGILGSGSSSASADLNIIFTVDEPRWVEFVLGCSGFAGGDGSAEVYVDGEFHAGAEAYGNDLVVFDYLLQPGIEYRLVASAFGGQSGDIFDYVSGSATIDVRSTCPFRGALQVGSNTFDTSGTNDQTLNLEGLCDPGTFGEDVIYNVGYYSFTPEYTSTYTFSTCNQTTLDTRLAVLGQGCDIGTVIACTDESEGCDNYTSILEVPLEAGTVYTLAVGATFEGQFDPAGGLTISLPTAVMYPITGSGNVVASGFTFSSCGQVDLSDSDHDKQEFDNLETLPLTAEIGYSGNGGTVESSGSASVELGYNGFSYNATTAAWGDTQTGANCEQVDSEAASTADVVIVLQHPAVLTIDYSILSSDNGATLSSVNLVDSTDNILFTAEDEAFGEATEGSESIAVLPGSYTLEIRNYAYHWGDWIVETCGVSVSVSAVSAGLEGDFNGDGLVNGADLGLLIGSWGTNGLGDLNGDGTVDSADLGLLLALWST